MGSEFDRYAKDFSEYIDEEVAEMNAEEIVHEVEESHDEVC